MQQYFFDIHDGIDVRDDVGRPFPSLEAARLHAIAHATEFVSELDGGGLGGYIVVTIRDAAATLAILRLVCQIEAPARASPPPLAGEVAA